MGNDDRGWRHGNHLGASTPKATNTIDIATKSEPTVTRTGNGCTVSRSHGITVARSHSRTVARSHGRRRRADLEGPQARRR